MTAAWTPERARRLEQLFAEGLRAAEVAKRLGVTRNAALGKRHRLKIDAAGRPETRAAELRPDPAWWARARQLRDEHGCSIEMVAGLCDRSVGAVVCALNEDYREAKKARARARNLARRNQQGDQA